MRNIFLKMLPHLKLAVGVVAIRNTMQQALLHLRAGFQYAILVGFNHETGERLRPQLLKKETIS